MTLELPIPYTDWCCLFISRENCPRRKLRKRIVPRLSIIATPGPFGKDINLYIARWLIFRLDWYRL